MELCETYREVARFHGKGPRHYARYMALQALSYVNAPKYQGIFETPRIQFLYFHHIYGDESGNFDRLVRTLSKTHTFISHSEAVDRLLLNKVDRPYISWSSDDGFKNNLAAAKILERYGASCCFFVNPNSIGLTDETQIKKFCAQKLNMPPTAFLNWDEVGQLLSAGHEIGSHTMGHDVVSRMRIDDFKEDLIKSKQVLEAECGTIKHFAYPYGRFEDFSKEAFDAVFETGYQSCSNAVRGCHLGNTDGMDKQDLFIRRDQVVAAWPLDHVRYFIYKSCTDSNEKTHTIPESYQQ